MIFFFLVEKEKRRGWSGGYLCSLMFVMLFLCVYLCLFEFLCVSYLCLFVFSTPAALGQILCGFSAKIKIKFLLYVNTILNYGIYDFIS